MSTTPTITAERVMETLDRQVVVPQMATFVVEDGQTAWDPSSTKRLIAGPVVVRYRRWVDGGIDATLSDL